MGLDMYLSAEKYNADGWTHHGVEKNAEFDEKVLKPMGLERETIEKLNNGCFISTTSVCIGYWRKANAIHGWFVRKCQDGIDECQESVVTREKLQELHDLCTRALESKNSELLTPVQGFFFGSKTIDEHYWDDIRHTIDVCKFALSLDIGFDFKYRASW